MPKKPFDLRKVESVLIGEPEKKKTRRKIPKSVKEAVWAKYICINKAEGKCYVCKRTIHITRFDVGHNKALVKGGSDNITNLRPICRSCNSAMGTMSIETYKRKYFSKSRKRKTTKKRSKAKSKKKKPTDLFQIPKIKLPKGYL